MRVWHRSLLLAALAALGSCTSEDKSISGGMRAHEPSLAVAPGATFAAWHGGSGDQSSIYVRRVEERGRPLSEAMAISDGKRLAYEPDLVIASGRLVIAWYESDPATGDVSAWLAGITPQGRREWLLPLAAGGEQARNPVVRQIGDHLDVGWIEQPASDDGSNRAEIWHLRVSLAGKAMGPPRRIGEANRDTWNLNAAVHGEALLVVYDAALGTRAHELHLLVAGAAEVRHRLLSADDGHASLYPDLQVDLSGQAALTWFDERDGNQEVYLSAAPFDRLVDGALPPPLRVSHTEGASIGAYLAWNGPVIGLAWSDELSGERDIFAQMFAADGKPLGGVRRLGAERETAGVPVIRASGSGFLVAWTDYLAEGGSGAHAHVVSSVIKLARLPVN